MCVCVHVYVCARVCVHCNNVKVISTLAGLPQLHLFRGFYSVLVRMGEYVSTQTLVIHQWAGPSVTAQLAPDSTPDRAE